MPEPAPRITLATQLVLHALLEEPTRPQYGLEIGQRAGLPSGTVHPILARLERLDWVESSWEDVDPHAEGRPARRYYRLTAVGVESSRAALVRATARGRSWVIRPAAGEA